MSHLQHRVQGLRNWLSDKGVETGSSSSSGAAQPPCVARATQHPPAQRATPASPAASGGLFRTLSRKRMREIENRKSMNEQYLQPRPNPATPPIGRRTEQHPQMDEKQLKSPTPSLTTPNQTASTPSPALQTAAAMHCSCNAQAGCCAGAVHRARWELRKTEAHLSAVQRSLSAEGILTDETVFVEADSGSASGSWDAASSDSGGSSVDVDVMQRARSQPASHHPPASLAIATKRPPPQPTPAPRDKRSRGGSGGKAGDVFEHNAEASA